MKVKLLFFFSFVLTSAALVQHGAKLPLSNKVERLWRKVFFFRATFFVANRIEVSPYHVSFKCISSHFRGLSLRQPKRDKRKKRVFDQLDPCAFCLLEFTRQKTQLAWKLWEPISVVWPSQNFYLGKTKPEMNLPWQIFDEFALGKSVLPR